MSLIYAAAGFVAGSVLTALLGVAFIRYKMKSQLGMMEEQMDLLMDSAEKIRDDDFEMPEDIQDVEPKNED